MRITTSVTISFAILGSLVAFLAIGSYNMQQGIVKTDEYNERMYGPALETSIEIINDFTLLQDIVQYNPDAHSKGEYLLTYDRLTSLYNDYRNAINAKGSDGQYILSEERRNAFLGYTNEMEKYTILFDEHARAILDIRYDPNLSQEQKQELIAEKMPLADEPMWQFWYYLDLAKDTQDYADLEERKELTSTIIASNETMTLLLLAGTLMAAGLAYVTVNRLNRRVRLLRRSAELIGKQDYQVPVMITGNDEMTILARDFEKMRKKVQSYEGELETLVHERTKQLETAYNDLKQVDTLKDEFINVAAHELRTPIQPILNYGELAQKGLISQEKAWEAVTQQARRLRQLANDILDVSRIDGRKLELEKKDLDINALVAGVADEKRLSLQKGVTFDLDLSDTRGVKLHADESRLLQVLANLIGNAAKFTKEGKITITTSLDKKKGAIAVTISDTGPGIPHSILSNLFGKFVTKSASEGTENGTGLGLYISKAIIQAHQGMIFGFNNEKGGASFRIILPVWAEGLPANYQEISVSAVSGGRAECSMKLRGLRQ